MRVGERGDQWVYICRYRQDLRPELVLASSHLRNLWMSRI
jgi:hypothetical protein